MTKYCDVHGAVEVDEDTGICLMLLAGDQPCGTKLKGNAADMEINRRATAIVQQPQQITTANTREDDSGKAMRQGAFLAAFAKTGRISKAAELAECDRTRHYDWLKEPEYSRAFDQAKLLAFHNLADEAWRRAMGADGAQASDRLMIKLLESLGPACGHPEFGIRSTHELSTVPGKPLELNVSPTEQLLSRIAGLVTGIPKAPGA